MRLYLAVSALPLFTLLAAASCGGGGDAGAGGAASMSSTGAASNPPSGAGGATSSTSSTGAAAGPPTPQACAHPPCLNVVNNCPFPLWIHAKNHDGVTLMPDNQKLAPGDIHQYDVPAEWPAARVNATWADPSGLSPDPDAYDKVEITVGGGKMNYNITYVDYLALPARMEAIDPSCPKTAKFDPRVSCDVPVARVLDGCPSGLLDGKRCLSAGMFCSKSANQGSMFCHALDAQVAACAAQNPATCGIAAQLHDTTVDVYKCDSYFDSQPANCAPASTTCHQDGNKWCAALNRGMLAQPESTDASLYYQKSPFNTYAKWVHDTCPGIYAFAYDDYPSAAGQSGYRSCTAARLDVTFCPGG